MVAESIHDDLGGRSFFAQGWSFRDDTTTVRTGPVARCAAVSVGEGWKREGQSVVERAMTTTVLVSVAASVLASLLVIVVVLLVRGGSVEPQPVDTGRRMRSSDRRRAERPDGHDGPRGLRRARPDAGGDAPQPGARRARRDDRPRRGAEPDARRGRLAAGRRRGAHPRDRAGRRARDARPSGSRPEEAEEYCGRRGACRPEDPLPVPRLRRLRAAPGLARSAPILSGLAVPIHGELETLGLLTVFSRSSRQPLDLEVIAEIEALALRAGAGDRRTRGASARRGSRPTSTR